MNYHHNEVVKDWLIIVFWTWFIITTAVWLTLTGVAMASGFSGEPVSTISLVDVILIQWIFITDYLRLW